MKLLAPLYASVLLLAAGPRIARLAERPMHADEAVQADQLGTLVETGVWRYDPRDYHGPVLPYLTAVVVWLAGAPRYTDFNETTLRIIPVLSGLLLALSPLLLARWLGRTQAVASSVLISVSPAMVYYSRYYIPEMVLTCLTAGLIVTWYRYQCEGSWGWALCVGLLSGLMFACKETAIIAIGCLMLAAGLTARARRPDWRHVLLGFAVAVVVIAGLLGGPAAFEALGSSLNRALQEQRHAHPWHYYLGLLLYSPGTGGWFWSEGIILALAALGILAAFREGWLAGSDRGLVRLLVVYTLSMIVVYSAIPYKTPWCLLGFLYGTALLAGVGLAALARISSRAVRVAALSVAAVCVVHLLYQAVLASLVYAADPRNPYAYVQTTRDVYAIRERLEGLAAADPQGKGIRIQVLSRENLWPLPWYVRSFPHVEWWRAVDEQMQPASVIIASPDMEAGLAHRLYEVPPPGQRPLYVSMFRRSVELRPGVELAGYVRKDVWDNYVRTSGDFEESLNR